MGRGWQDGAAADRGRSVDRGRALEHQLKAVENSDRVSNRAARRLEEEGRVDVAARGSGRGHRKLRGPHVALGMDLQRRVGVPCPMCRQPMRVC